MKYVAIALLMLSMCSCDTSTPVVDAVAEKQKRPTSRFTTESWDGNENEPATGILKDHTTGCEFLVIKDKYKSGIAVAQIPYTCDIDKSRDFK